MELGSLSWSIKQRINCSHLPILPLPSLISSLPTLPSLHRWNLLVSLLQAFAPTSGLLYLPFPLVSSVIQCLIQSHLLREAISDHVIKQHSPHHFLTLLPCFILLLSILHILPIKWPWTRHLKIPHPAERYLPFNQKSVRIVRKKKKKARFWSSTCVF